MVSRLVANAPHTSTTVRHLDAGPRWVSIRPGEEAPTVHRRNGWFRGSSLTLLTPQPPSGDLDVGPRWVSTRPGEEAPTVHRRGTVVSRLVANAPHTSTTVRHLDAGPRWVSIRPGEEAPRCTRRNGWFRGSSLTLLTPQPPSGTLTRDLAGSRHAPARRPPRCTGGTGGFEVVANAPHTSTTVRHLDVGPRWVSIRPGEEAPTVHPEERVVSRLVASAPHTSTTVRHLDGARWVSIRPGATRRTRRREGPRFAQALRCGVRGSALPDREGDPLRPQPQHEAEGVAGDGRA